MLFASVVWALGQWSPRRQISLALTRFAANERGSLTVFATILLILMLVLGGMGIDLMRHENARADLQNALDRAVLAVTNLNEDLTGTTVDENGDTVELSPQQVAERTVHEYMATRNYQTAGINVSVNLTSSPTKRQVIARANQPVDMFFLYLAGLPSLDVNVAAGAEQAIGKTEIALILDVSGSMGWNSTTSPGTKIGQLKTAAKQFVRTVLDGNNSDYVLVTIVPYSSRTSITPAMAGHYNFQRDHGYSTCIDYRDLDFTSPAIPLQPVQPYRQSQEYIEGTSNGRRIYGCPHTNNAITAFSNNVNELETAIDALSVEYWTASYMGMKWGAAMLDPSSSAIVDARIQANELPATFAGFPHEWDDPEANKFVVLMTDGVNTNLNKIKEEIYEAKRDPDQPGDEAADYYHENQPGGDKYTELGRNGGNALLQDICSSIKSQPKRPIIYTVGFELNDGSNDAKVATEELKKCAKNPSPDASDPYSTHFEVEGVEISAAFKVIAEEIVRLKLSF